MKFRQKKTEGMLELNIADLTTIKEWIEFGPDHERMTTSTYREKIEEYIPDVEVAEEGMTLWQIIKAGGEIMIVLALLSVAALALIIYYFLTFDPKTLLPEDFGIAYEMEACFLRSRIKLSRLFD